MDFDKLTCLLGMLELKWCLIFEKKLFSIIRNLKYNNRYWNNKLLKEKEIFNNVINIIHNNSVKY